MANDLTKLTESQQIKRQNQREKYIRALDAMEELLAKFVIDGWSDFFHYEQEQGAIQQSRRWLADMDKYRKDYSENLPSDRATVGNSGLDYCSRCHIFSQPQFILEERIGFLCIECIKHLANGGEEEME